ncbi:TRAP-type C4-dicarboxylate transport system substrate-binding protein [Rhodobium orientis]|uniref:C4-dicarboxylate ABC transporter substrate-binding protein n=1 Tax=Rhodobium orientis TaxID=34017 RepID=A0A327JZK9_9HYPH|nr:TRAP transporter substrate-binding protein DctP [Rhodobium orientis]MBB4303759.1 TRAP-type C4-dicarboxylate transport system substrate-binding protein [Rhodobium orientis]MBK5951787.1 C4-dicarboxylate ABC transporter substrate-binding protein [Rhodobium orientis]RAI28538.1 C4-dicarboxylate ABC transporter substrate-binding protein [Rhodobium orientis]
MTQTRRTFLKTSAAVVGGTAMFGLTAGRAAAETTMTGVSYLPPSYKALAYGSAGFVERLDASDAVKVDYYDSGKLLKADEQLPALRSGTIDFMFHTSSYITRSIPILGITGLPGVVEELYENPDRLKKGSPLFNLINEELAKEDLYMVSMMGNILQPEYIWSTKAAPVRSIADLSGKKVRVVSFEATKVIEGFGGAAVRIPSSELYLALQRNTVDAAVANISTIIGRSLQEQIDFVYKLPMTAYGIGLYTTTRGWETMGEAEKAAFTEAADWFDENGAAYSNNTIYPDEYWPMVEAENVEIIEPSKEDLQTLTDAAADVRAKWVSEVGEDVGARAIALALGKAE